MAWGCRGGPGHPATEPEAVPGPLVLPPPPRFPRPRAPPRGPLKDSAFLRAILFLQKESSKLSHISPHCPVSLPQTPAGKVLFHPSRQHVRAGRRWPATPAPTPAPGQGGQESGHRPPGPQKSPARAGLPGRTGSRPAGHFTECHGLQVRPRRSRCRSVLRCVDRARFVLAARGPLCVEGGFFCLSPRPESSPRHLCGRQSPPPVGLGRAPASSCRASALRAVCPSPPSVLG